jgi:hypothetical protein
MMSADPEHKLMQNAAIKTGKFVDAAADAMPVDTSEDVAAKNGLLEESARIWWIWLQKRDPKDSKNWYYVLKKFDDLEDWSNSKLIAEASIKRVGGKKNDKYIRYFERSLANSTLEMAKQAYKDGNKEETDRLFAQARPVYAELVGPSNNATNDVLEQAAQVFGGFLVGPNARGNYEFYQGNAEYERAVTIWNTLERRFRKDLDEARTNAERDAANRAYQRAKFYKFLAYYQNIKSEPSQTRRLRDQVDAVFLREKGSPGGAEFTPMWRWLKDQL